MKVLVLSSLAYSLVNFRGELLRSMVAAGNEVVACAPDPDPAIETALGKMGIGLRTVAMARTGTNPFADLLTLWGYYRLIRRERPDVVLAYTQKPIIYGGIAARLAGGTRYFAMCSGLGHAFSGGDGLRPRTLKAIVSWLYRMAVARAEAVFTFNRDDAGEMRRHGITTDRHAVIQVPGSGIDTAAFARQPVPEGAPVFLTIARLMRDKGLGEFVAAARALRQAGKPARFQVLGPYDSNPTGISPAEIQAWHDEGIIEYLGETRDVRPFLAQSSVFVLPTYYREGLPRTILEAMATGRAIVTTDMPGCRETIFEGENVNGMLVPPRDATALAAAMQRFIDEPDLAERYGASSRRMAETLYDVRKVNAQLLDVMQLYGDFETAPVAAPAGTGWRRLLDIAGAGAGLILTAPLMLLLALGVLADSGSPVLFRQRRAGLGGLSFQLVKFRSMREALDGAGRLLPDAERITAFGRFLRRSRLDELPELWNVLRGDMSFFGPRPLLPETIDAWGRRGAERCSVRPGLTGWAQIHGGPLLDPEEKLALDLWYVRNRTFALDFSVLARTFAVLLRDDRVDGREIRRVNASLGSRRG
jgi:lipopolysaccharide/colanic/teichoic acid biosynthesis glycosyltransferase/glycosyltransferase involved in cell wall biosynthesis